MVVPDQAVCTFTPTAGSPARRGPNPAPDGGLVVVVVGAVVVGVVVVGAVVVGVVVVGAVVVGVGGGAGAEATWGLGDGPQALSSAAPASTVAEMMVRLRIGD